MGFVVTVAGNIALTSLAIGVLKRQGVITLHPDKIRNDGVRSLLTSAVGLGETVALRAENLWHDLTK